MVKCLSIEVDSLLDTKCNNNLKATICKTVDCNSNTVIKSGFQPLIIKTTYLILKMLHNNNKIMQKQHIVKINIISYINKLTAEIVNVFKIRN